MKTIQQLERENPQDFKNPIPTEAMVWVDIRFGRKLIASKKAPLRIVQGLMVNSGINAAKIMVEAANLNLGNSFNFKHQGKSITVKPLIGYVGLY